MSSDATISSGLTSGRLTLGGVKPATRANESVDVSVPVAVAKTDSVSLSSPEFLEKITQVQGFLEQISYGQSVISTALDNVETIVAKLEEVGGIAVKLDKILAASLSEELVTPQVKELKSRLAQLFADIDNISENSGFPDENVLRGDVVSFAVDANNSLHLSVEGYELSNRAFGFEDLAYNDSQQAQLLKGLVLQALDQSALLRSQLRVTSYELETRKEFSESTIDVLLASVQQAEGNSDEASALRSLQSNLVSRGDEAGEYLAFEAQYELLEQFK